jgi:hypothetical protein
MSNSSSDLIKREISLITNRRRDRVHAESQDKKLKKGGNTTGGAGGGVGVGGGAGAGEGDGVGVPVLGENVYTAPSVAIARKPCA